MAAIGSGLLSHFSAGVRLALVGRASRSPLGRSDVFCSVVDDNCLPPGHVWTLGPLTFLVSAVGVRDLEICSASLLLAKSE